MSAWTASGQPRQPRLPQTPQQRVEKRLEWWADELDRAFNDHPDDTTRAGLGVLWRWLTSECHATRTGQAKRIADSVLGEVAQYMETACRMLANMDPETGQPIIPQPGQQEAS